MSLASLLAASVFAIGAHGDLPQNSDSQDGRWQGYYGQIEGSLQTGDLSISEGISEALEALKSIEAYESVPPSFGIMDLALSTLSLASSFYFLRTEVRRREEEELRKHFPSVGYRARMGPNQEKISL